MCAPAAWSTKDTRVTLDRFGAIPRQSLWVQCVRPRSDTARPIASSTRAWKDAICSDLVFRRQSLSLVYSRLSMAISAWRGSLEGTWGKRFDRSPASSCAMPHQCRTCSRACCMNSAALDSSSVAVLLRVPCDTAKHIIDTHPGWTLGSLTNLLHRVLIQLDQGDHEIWNVLHG